MLDGIGGVNIVVKADVHRSGQFNIYKCEVLPLINLQELTSHATPSKIRQKPRVSPKWPRGQDMRSLDFLITLSGTSTRKKSLETLESVHLTRPVIRFISDKRFRRSPNQGTKIPWHTTSVLPSGHQLCPRFSTAYLRSSSSGSRITTRW